MQEFFRPHSYDNTEDVLIEAEDSIAQSESFNEHPEETTQPSRPHEYYQNAPSAEETEATIKLDMSDAIETESLVDVRRTILKHFKKHTSTFRGMNLSDPVTAHAQHRLWEQSIKQEVTLTNQDLLLVNGVFFALFSNGDVQTTSLFSGTSEVRGVFAGIHLAQTPTTAELLRALSLPGSHDRRTQATTLSPVLRITNATVIDYRDNGAQRVIYADHLTIDIPLIYETLDIDRVLPPHFN
jgi:hypothetical protein